MDVRRWAIPAGVLTTSGIMLLVIACGTGDGGKGDVAARAKPTPAAADPAAPAGPAAVEVSKDPKLGRIVVNGEGRTLYRFDKDTSKPTTSACVAACAKTWLPLTISGKEADKGKAAVKGLNAKLVGKFRRPDGAWQVTLGGWPLYSYTKDTGPGDVNGEGISGIWHAANPLGRKAAPPPATPSPRPGQSGKTVLKVVENDELGRIVANGQGMTLYGFEKDKSDPTVSNCNGACAKTWPPLRWTKGMRLTGIDRDLVGNYMRKDGICQVTLDGWPLYLYTEDTGPGEVNGQGVKGTWFATAPNGDAIKTKLQGGGY